ncbi:hypothetical protein V6N12_027565 [Hibiscus sabdariffa]|uniref:Uncharacterized protein n=1 Tax=Hibiscus sabdariffa TaxID=183260 RepID=A0ABR2F393_9ROSI
MTLTPPTSCCASSLTALTFDFDTPPILPANPTSISISTPTPSTAPNISWHFYPTTSNTGRIPPQTATITPKVLNAMIMLPPHSKSSQWHSNYSLRIV